MNQPRKRQRGAEYAKLVLAAMKAEARPMSAYEIMAALREQAQLAPQTIYRALDRLIAAGLARKLESLNAFTACQDPTIGPAAAFAICDSCGAVSEFVEPSIASALSNWSKDKGFTLKGTTVELHGICTDCQHDASAHTAPAHAKV